MPLLGLLRQAANDGHPAAHPHISSVLIAPEVATQAHGRTLTCWTVNRPADLEVIRSCGMQGVITDDPVATREVLDRGLAAPLAG